MNDDSIINDVEIKKPSMVAKKKEISIKIKIKTAIIVAVIIIVGVTIFSYKGLFIAATVNGHYITRLDVIKELEKNSGKAILDSLIVHNLVDEEIKKNNFSISDNEINDEVKKIEDSLKAQGQTLEQALSSNEISLDVFKKQISFQKKLEKLLADKIAVVDNEIEKYITDNKITIPKEQEDDYRNNIKEQLKQQKFNTSVQSYIDSLKSQAKINYYINY